MIIFTPNTVIQSSQVNGNFSELNNKVGALVKLNKRIDNGTGTRSTASSTTHFDVPGSSFVYTPAVNVTIYISLTVMCLVSAGTGQVGLSIGGVEQEEFTYFSNPTYWDTYTLPYVADINAGVATTIVARWYQNVGGTMTMCNANTDHVYPSYIRGIAIPR